MIIGKTQQKILAYIRTRSPTYTYEIATALGIDRGDVTKAVQALIVKGLVSHCDGPTDQKSAGPERRWLAPTKKSL